MTDLATKCILALNLIFVTGMGLYSYRQTKRMHPEVAQAMRPFVGAYLVLFLMLAGFLAYYCIVSTD